MKKSTGSFLNDLHLIGSSLVVYSVVLGFFFVIGMAMIEKLHTKQPTANIYWGPCALTYEDK